MFTLSFLSGIAGLVLGWGDLYRDYLSREVVFPAWLAILLFLAVVLAVVIVRTPTPRKLNAELKPRLAKRYGVQQVKVDGIDFQKCEFHGSELIFSGEDFFSLQKCSLENFGFSFAGPAATTVHMLTMLARDPGLLPLVEQILANIRAGKMSQAIPPIEH